ncbi:MAG: hypothetical protein AB1609_00765 [Bacillota bacterium]
MTGKEIKTAAEAYIGETMDDTDALEGINAALRWLNDNGLVYDSTEIAAEAKTWTSLPVNFITVSEVTNSAGELYTDYRQRVGQIIFAEADTYTVFGRRVVAQLANLNETPELHLAFHGSLVDHLIGWWKLKQDPDDADGDYHVKKFERDAMRTSLTLRSSRGPATATITVVR